MFFSELVFFVLVVKGVRGDSDHHHHGEHSSDECTYPVQHVWMKPGNNYRIDSGIRLNKNANSAKKCQQHCNDDMNCKSVVYRWKWVQRKNKYRTSCLPFNTTIPELSDMKKYDQIKNITPSTNDPVLITYDKCCGEEHIKHAENKCTNLYVDKHEYASPDQSFYQIKGGLLHNHGHGEHGSENITVNLAKCKAFCNKDVNCRSVLFQVHEEGGHRRCRTFIYSVADLKGTNLLVKLSDDDKKNYTKYITYDRYCGPLSSHRCTNRYKASYDNKAPLYPKYYVGVNMMEKTATDTAQKCKDYCTADENCWNVVDLVYDGKPMCSKFNITVQRLMDMGKHDEIQDVTKNPGVKDNGTYKSYDRYCVGCHKFDVKYATLCHPIGWRDESTCDDTPSCCSVELQMSDASFSTCLRPSF